MLLLPFFGEAFNYDRVSLGAYPPFSSLIVEFSVGFSRWGIEDNLLRAPEEMWCQITENRSFLVSSWAPFILRWPSVKKKCWINGYLFKIILNNFTWVTNNILRLGILKGFKLLATHAAITEAMNEQNELTLFPLVLVGLIFQLWALRECWQLAWCGRQV